MAAKEPMRTCVGCRRAVPQGTVVRVAVVAGRAVVDERRRRPGRGAWVHPVKSCVDGAVKGGLARSFRKKIDPAAVAAWIESTLATASEKS